MSPSAHDQQSPSAAEKLRAIVEDPNGFILAPGVYDGLSARIALEVGFDSLYMVCLNRLVASRRNIN
jgi:2-methylisocitrate lyase-like PEP mutase family enzyme